MSKADIDVTIPEVDVTNELNLQAWFRDGDIELPAIDTSQVSVDIVKRILAATSAEDIMKPVTTEKAEDHLGETLLWRDYKRMPSTVADSALRFYLLCDVVNGSGEVLQLTCGSMNVVARLVAMRANGHLPMYAALVQASRPTAAGYYPMDLEGRTPESMTSGGAKGADF